MQATASEKSIIRARCRDRYKNRCAVPDCKVVNVNISVHHIVPLSCQGSWDQGNLCLLCAPHHNYVHRRNGRVNNVKNSSKGYKFLNRLRGRAGRTKSHNSNGRSSNRISSKNGRYAFDRKKNGRKNNGSK